MGSGASTEQGQAAPAIIDGEAAILERAGGVLLPRDDLYESLKAKLNGADRPVAVVAPSGSGKSTFMANCVTRLREEYDIVRAVFVGSAGGSTNLVRVLSELCASLVPARKSRESLSDLCTSENSVEELADDVLGLSGLLEKRLQVLQEEKKKVLIVVDAVNELEGAAALSLGWLPRRSGIVVTTIRGGANSKDPNVKTVLAALKKRFEITEPLVVPPLSSDDQISLLTQLAGRAPTSQEQEALKTKKDAASPLYIKLLAPKLARGSPDGSALHPLLGGKSLNLTPPASRENKRRGGGKLKRAASGVIAANRTRSPAKSTRGTDPVSSAPDTIQAVFDDLLVGLPADAAKKILTAIYVSGGGVWASQLRELARHSTLEGWLGPLVRCGPDGRVAFVHQQARDAVQRKWLKTPEDVQKAHAALASYFSTLYKFSDHDREEDKALECQILTRLPRHLIGSNDAERLKDPAFGERKCAAGLVGDLVHDFADAGYEDFAECVRANAHVLAVGRYVPGLFAQQLANSRDDSAIDTKELRAPFRWVNKDQKRPACLGIMSSPATHYWAAAASKSGKSLALGGSDKLIHIIDAQDQYEKALLTGHQDDIVSVSFSPTEEATLVSLARVSRQEKAAFDLFVWDAHAATKLAAAQGAGSASDARWSSDGLYIAVACQGRCEIYSNKATLQKTLKLDGDAAACCFSPTNHNGDNQFVVCAVNTHIQAKSLTGKYTPPTFEGQHPEKVNDVHWACGFVATACDDGSVVLFDEKSGARLAYIEAHEDICKSVRLTKSPGAGIHLVSGGEDRSARLFRLSGGRLSGGRLSPDQAVLRGHSAAVAHVAHLPGGSSCLTTSEDGSCRIWDYARAFGQDKAPGSEKGIAACVFVEEPAGLIVADGAGVLRLFDPDGKGEVWRTEPLEAQHRAITALAVAEGGARVAVAMYKRVHLREIAGGAEAAPPLVFDDWVNCCAFVGGGAVAFAGDAASVNVWDRGNTITVTHDAAKKTDSVLAMACRITGDEATIATGDNDGRINVWTEKEREDTSEQREFEQYRFTKIEGWVVSICFYAHGLAACTSLGRVCVLEPGKCEVISMSTSLECAMAWVGSVGDRLVTACEAKLVHAWRRQGDSLETLGVDALFPGAARFGSPDGVGGQGAVAGKRIAVGDESGRLYVLDTEFERRASFDSPPRDAKPRHKFVRTDSGRLFLEEET